ncbi:MULTISPECIES: hypothetical protein [unclassified Undibacterium]|uniref:hypothetical protein n=1 Tax=unclassified Undibacterium TaxID=2630295 RepID=UPI002AC9D35C|nr:MULTISPECIES: hypothetical protein [unclassified Undibacterium]MEB0140866.1 hypothetical protein [Undibacterium sp. CCC2.1]MEB0173822.1 hypothetical protein [Undibacterium sp. CCC1.1]MEB0177819.1 hypothetical protein [Undibacterium sp. CCC3.4]MEB0216701.1 hypothetical protein [Undibacterium sp. 5I2]WPX44383.1 hypothetical protein RHM61_03885 [Undibacterium sp. CCC3.4]
MLKKNLLSAIVTGSVLLSAGVQAADSTITFNLEAYVPPANFSATAEGWTPGVITAPMNVRPDGSFVESAAKNIRLVVPASVGAKVYMYTDNPGSNAKLTHSNGTDNFGVKVTLSAPGANTINLNSQHKDPASALALVDKTVNTAGYNELVSMLVSTEVRSPTSPTGRYAGQITMVFDQLL